MPVSDYHAKGQASPWAVEWAPRTVSQHAVHEATEAAGEAHIVRLRVSSAGRVANEAQDIALSQRLWGARVSGA